MPLVRTMVTIPADTAVGRDALVNTWGFNIHTGTASAALPSIKARLKTFYDAWSSYRGSSCDWVNASIKGYDMSHSKPRAPVFDELLGLSAAQGTNTMPHECAVCLSFQATKSSGVSQRRKRGRIYLGTFTMSSHNGTSTPIGLDSTFHTLLQTAAQAMLNGMSTDPDYDWVVISEATGAPASYDVHDGWIDNAWDTQRRRGQAATSRKTFTLAV
jgi:hypothetical protein